jgi:3-hydroxybutyryl-CoA dehydrogenase
MSKNNSRAVVVGGGTMGSGIALVFAAGNWAVDIVEPAAATRAALPAYLRESLQRMGAHADTSRIATVGTLSDVAWSDVDLVVESANEDLALKQRIFAELEALTPAHVPLASNSTTLAISAIGRGLKTRSRMLGLHFLMPAQFVPVVEVIGSEQTEPRLIDEICAIMRKLGKRPVRVNKELPGFLVNRIQTALMREAVALIEQGVASPEDIDTAVRYGFGFRYIACGPITQKEHSGWDINYKLQQAVFPSLCNDAAPSPLLEKMIAAGHFGMKTGQGFMRWDDAKIARERARYEKVLQATLDILETDVQLEGKS